MQQIAIQEKNNRNRGTVPFKKIALPLSGLGEQERKGPCYELAVVYCFWILIAIVTEACTG
jgi:hypothetical protein